MTLYRVLFAFDALVMLVLAYFFLDGLKYSSSAETSIIWFLILAVPIAIIFAAWIFHENGRKLLASWLLVLLAIPPVFFVGFFGLLLLLNPNWH
jgi:hypothetical protein